MAKLTISETQARVYVEALDWTEKNYPVPRAVERFRQERVVLERKLERLDRKLRAKGARE